MTEGFDLRDNKAVAELCALFRSGGAFRAQRLLDHDFAVETTVKFASIDPSLLDNFKIHQVGERCDEMRASLIAEGHSPSWVWPPIEEMYALAEQRYGPSARDN